MSTNSRTLSMVLPYLAEARRGRPGTPRALLLLGVLTVLGQAGCGEDTVAGDTNLERISKDAEGQLREDRQDPLDLRQRVRQLTGSQIQFGHPRARRRIQQTGPRRQLGYLLIAVVRLADTS